MKKVLARDLLDLVELLLGSAADAKVCAEVADLDVTAYRRGNGATGFAVTVSRRAGLVKEREAVDVAVKVHRLMEAAGARTEAEFLSYRPHHRVRCFVIEELPPVA